MQNAEATKDIPRMVNVHESVEKLLTSLDLDEAGSARAAIALALAAKLDEASLSDSGAIAMATAGIAKELRAVLDAILAAGNADDEFVAGLFAPVGDPANT